MKEVFAILFSLFVVQQVYAEDRIQLERDSVVGNDEAPKALYIVPWRPLNPVGIEGLKIETLLDEQLELIEPEVFRRQVELYHVTQSARKNASNK